MITTVLDLAVLGIFGVCVGIKYSVGHAIASVAATWLLMDKSWRK